MATRVYLPSSGAAAVTPSTWNFGAQINPLTFAGSLTKTSSAMTTKTEATGTTNPTARAMLRYVIGPLEAQAISGTIKAQMLGSENNANANATPAIAVKIIQPDGSDRAVLLAQTASDSATAGNEFATSLTNATFKNASEVAAMPLSTQSSTRGDYLVIELGFRSATGTSRNISLRYGDTGGTDLAEDTSTTADNVPWVEFSGDLRFIRTMPTGTVALTGQAPLRIVNNILAMGLGALSLAGLAPTVAVQAPVSIAIPAGAVAITGGNVGVAFQGPEIGRLVFTGHAPMLSAGSGSSTTISVDVGSVLFTGRAPTVVRSLDLSADLVGHWPMDEASGSDSAIDATGRGNDLTVLGGVIDPTSIDGTPARDFEFGDATCLTGADSADNSLGTDGAVTFLVRATIESAGAVSYLIRKDQAADATYDYELFQGTDQFRFGLKSAGDTGAIGSQSETLVPGATYIVACGHDPDTDKIWIKVNAAAREETSWTTGTRDSSSTTFRIGARSGVNGTGTGENWDGKIGPVSMWKRSLSDDEIAFWTAVKGDYDAITGSDDHLVAVPVGALAITGLTPAANTGLAITVPAGALSLSGTAPSLVFGVEVPAGAVVLSGLAPSLAVAGTGTTIASSSGAAVWTGYAPSLAISIGADAGSLALTGYAPSTGLGVQLSAGALALSGHAPTVSIDVGRAMGAGSIALTGLAPSIATSIATPAGSLVLGGLAPAPTQTVLITPVSGSVAWTGIAPSIATSVAVPAGALALSGQAPLGSVGIIREPSSGSIAFTGASPSFAFSIGVPAGQLDLTGLAPSVNGSTGISPAAGSLVLTGLAPTLQFAFVIPTQAGALALSGAASSSGFGVGVQAGAVAFVGQAPSLGGTTTIAPAAGSVALSGLAPSVSIGYVVAAQAGSVVFTGAAPVVSTGVVHDVPAGALRLQGYAPSATFDLFISPAAGVLSITGQAPTSLVAVALAEAFPGTGSLVFTGYAPTVVAIPVGDIVTTANCYFRRAVSTERTAVLRTVTTEASAIRRTATTESSDFARTMTTDETTIRRGVTSTNGER